MWTPRPPHWGGRRASFLGGNRFASVRLLLAALCPSDVTLVSLYGSLYTTFYRQLHLFATGAFGPNGVVVPFSLRGQLSPAGTPAMSDSIIELTLVRHVQSGPAPGEPLRTTMFYMSFYFCKSLRTDHKTHPLLLIRLHPEETLVPAPLGRSFGDSLGWKLDLIRRTTTGPPLPAI